LPREPGVQATFAREYEYKRHGGSACWPASTCSPARFMPKDRHRSCEFIEFLKRLDAAYLAHTAIKLILDNHSAHISKETKAWLAQSTRALLRIHLHAQTRLLA
jgi:hypothetical protein